MSVACTRKDSFALVLWLEMLEEFSSSLSSFLFLWTGELVKTIFGADIKDYRLMYDEEEDWEYLYV